MFFEVWLMILKAKARLVGGHSYITLISLMDFGIDAKTILCHIMPRSLLCIFVHLEWKTKQNHTDESGAILPLEEKLSLKITAL